MATLSPLHRQVNHASQRLFLQTLIDSLVWGLIGAVAVAVVWFLVEPFAFYLFGAEPPAQLRWMVAGGAGVLGVAVAVSLAFVLAPPKLEAALALDDRFGLRERVTTSLLLTPDLHHLPAAQALLEDADRRVAGLDVSSRFPLRIGWNAAAIPVLAAALALLAAFYDVRLSANTDPNDPDGKKPPEVVVTPEIEKELDKLKKDTEQKKQPPTDDAKLKELQAELDRIATRPRKNEDDLRDRFGEMDKLEPDLLQKKKDIEDKMKAQQDRLDRLAKKPKNEGPANDLRDALSKGNFDKAQEELDRLMKKMQDGQMTPEEREQLKKQLDELNQELERLARNTEEEQRLKDLAEKGEIDQETLERELEELKKQEQDLKDLEELAKELEELEQAMEKGDGQACEQCKGKIAARMKKMGRQSGDAEQLQRDLEQLRAAKKAIAQGMGKQGGGPPGGLRPESKEGETNTNKTRVQGQHDPKGRLNPGGQGPPGRSFKPKSEEEMAGAIRQAQQDAPEAINRQRLPRGASDLARGYYENLGGQKDEKKK